MDILRIPDEVYAEAAELLLKAQPESCDLKWSTLRDASAYQAYDACLERLDLPDAIESELRDPSQGISAVDIPSSTFLDAAQDMWLGSVMAASLVERLYPVARNGATGLPFTIYNASSIGAAHLIEHEIADTPPSSRLGFHTDGQLVSNGSICSPAKVATYNVFINYNQTGEFHWVPFHLWDEFEYWREMLGDERFEISITPPTTRDANGQFSTFTDAPKRELPLFFDVEGASVLYMNGEIVGCSTNSQISIDVIHKMKESLSACRNRISFPQKARRLVVMNNWLGAHARDIFGDPIDMPWDGVGYTRSFLRFVSLHSVTV